MKVRGFLTRIAAGLLVVLATGSLAVPEEPLPVFRQVSLEEGLSQAAIRAIAQDENGFLWIGTEDGLNRYDGYGFTVFRNDPNDPGSLPDNGINAIAPGKGSVLWVGTTDRGVAKLDLRTYRFERFLPGGPGGLPAGPIGCILEDRAGRLWAGVRGRGLAFLEPGAGSFHLLEPNREDGPGFPSANVLTLVEDGAGILWAGTQGQGVLKIDPAKKMVLARFDHDPANPDVPANAVVPSLAFDQHGRLWGGGGSLAVLDPKTNEIRVFRHDPDNPASFPSRQVRSLALDAHGRVFMATDNGVVRFDPETAHFEVFRNRLEDSGSLPSNRTNAVLIERSGMLWVGLDGAGLAVMDLSGSAFRSYRFDAARRNGLTAKVVRGVHEAPDGTVWLGLSGGGLNALDPATGDVRAFRAGPSGLSLDDVWNVTVDGDGAVWAATLGAGLNRIDPKSGQIEVFRASRSDASALTSDRLRIVITGRDGYLWIGTEGGGLCCFDRKVKEALCYRFKEGDSSSLSNNVVRAVHEGASGALWVGTDQGINRLDRSTGKFTRFLNDLADPRSLGIARVYGLLEGEDGILWAGTPRGLVRLDPRTGAVERYRERDGLPNESVYSVLADQFGSLWLSTNRGLARMWPAGSGGKPRFELFDRMDGLQGDEFNGGAFHSGPAGTLWFGGIQGVTGIRPEAVKKDEFAPPVALLSFSKLGRQLPPADWLAPGRIVLGPKEGFFSIEFTALAFRAAAKNRYSWKLEGLDEDWIPASARRRADYTSVPPGEYVFRVKAANKDGVWNQEGRSLRIIVRPPWWRTSAATGGWILILAASIAVVSRLEKRRVLGKERERTQLVEAELRAKAAEAQARAVQAEAFRKAAELEEARQMQLSLLPRDMPRVPGLTVAATALTATEVGGDTWDWAVDSRGGLALVIGDATGHGVRAGTVVSVMKGLFRGDPFPEDLGRFLDRCGRVLRDLGLPRLHMALAVLTIRGELAALASAGMPPALVYRARTGDVEEYLVPGAPLGALVDRPHECISFLLSKGDAVLLSSDGLAESPGTGGEPLGYPRVRELFREVAPLPPREALLRITQRESEWRSSESREDDLTLVLVRRDS